MNIIARPIVRRVCRMEDDSSMTGIDTLLRLDGATYPFVVQFDCTDRNIEPPYSQLLTREQARDWLACDVGLDDLAPAGLVPA